MAKAECDRIMTMNCLANLTQRTGEPEAHARASVPERFRRLKWNEVVWSGDFVATDPIRKLKQNAKHYGKTPQDSGNEGRATRPSGCVHNRRPKVALFNVEGTYYAIGDTCTHRGGPLSEGDVQGTKVTCPWHGAHFDLKTGAVLGPPAQKGVPSYKVTVEGDDIKVEV
jgi:nitrite reductase/ring-hydroxylating ferredoxin subunit